MTLFTGRKKKWIALMLTGGILGLCLFLAGRNGGSPVKVTFLNWKTVSGEEQACFEVENVSGEIILTQPHCRVLGKGIRPVFVDLQAGPEWRELKPRHTALVSVAIPASATGEITVRFMGVQPRSLTQELAVVLDRWLARISVRVKAVDDYHDDSWAVDCVISRQNR